MLRDHYWLWFCRVVPGCAEDGTRVYHLWSCTIPEPLPFPFLRSLSRGIFPWSLSAFSPSSGLGCHFKPGLRGCGGGIIFPKLSKCWTCEISPNLQSKGGVWCQNRKKPDSQFQELCQLLEEKMQKKEKKGDCVGQNFPNLGC